MSKVSESTLALRADMDAYLEEFEAEFRRQATKQNSSSERRMRALLRKFAERVYVPYRDSTLRRRAEDAENAAVPF